MSATGHQASGDSVSQIRQAVEAAGIFLQAAQYKQLSAYISLILRWNSRINLTAVREPERMISRHLLESIACALALPPGVSSLLDFGAGAGLPGIPIAICRPEIRVTLAESQTKKAAFLQEAVRVVGLPAGVHAGRAETIALRFDCVAMRAVDQMERAVAAARLLLVSQGWLAVMTTLSALPAMERAAGTDLSWVKPIPLPGGEQRVLLLGRISPPLG